MDSFSPSRRVGFGGFVLDLETRVLTRDGAVVRLPAKVIDTLIVLVQARGELVTKETLLAEVWPKTIVEESGLQRNISLLRKEFQNQGAGDLIETVPKRGYRFTGQLHEVVESVAKPVAKPVAEPVAAVPAGGQDRNPRVGLGVVLAALVGVAAAGLYLARAGGAAPSTDESSKTPAAELQAQVAQVTSNAAGLSVVAAAISPDGRWFAYDERGALRLREVATGEVRDLVSPPGVITSYITWSASGEDVLICGVNPETRISELWRVPRSGAPPARLMDDVSMATASPTGDRIAFVRGQYELWTIAADGTTAELFMHAPENRRLYFRPGYSRDGKRLYVFLYGHVEPWLLLHVYDIETRKLVFEAPTELVQDFALLDDATMLAAMYIGGAYQRGTYLATLALDFEKQRVTETHRLPDWPYYRVYEISATADGRAAAFVRDQTQSDIYLADLAADGITLSNVRRVTLDDGADRLSGWTADSRALLFHANREKLGAYRQDLDAVRATPLGDETRQNHLPVATPDGRWLFYMSRAATGHVSPDNPQTLMRQSLRDPGPAVPLLTTGDPMAALNCARHAPRCIFAEAKDGRTTFSDLDADTGTFKALFTLPLRFDFGFYWAVSPDGRSLAYVERASDGMRIAIRDLDSLGSIRASLPVEGNGMLRSVTWDVAGEGLYVVQCVGEPGMLLHVDMQARARVMHRFHSSCDGWAIPSPDGHRLAFVEWTSTGNLWMLTR